MSNPEPGPMTPEECDEISTRGALIAQLRAQRRVGTMMLTELRECREENARLRKALEKIAFDAHAPSRDPQGNSVEWYAEQAEIWAQKALDEWAAGE